MQTRNIPFLLVLGLGIGGTFAACGRTESEPEPCWGADGDATCATRYPDGDRPYCTHDVCDGESERFHGCVAERPPDECYSPCGADESVAENGACLAADEGADEGSESGGSTPDPDSGLPCKPKDCIDPAAPFCGDAGECVACDATSDPDAACADLNPGAPVCADGLCMECDQWKTEACTGATPVCDLDKNFCIGCTEHAQCPDSACNLVLGNCMDPTAVVHIDGDGGQDFTTLAAGLAAHVDATELTVILHEKSGAPFAYVGVEIHENDYLAIRAAPDESPLVTGVGGNSALEVTTAATLFLQGISVSGTQGKGVGLRVSVGEVWLQECRVLNNTGGGIVLETHSSSLVLENSFVGGNVNDVPALSIERGSADIVASTLAGGMIGSAALTCGDSPMPKVRNSLLISRQLEPEVQCAHALLKDNALEMIVGGNVSLGVMPNTSWFVDYASGDFHLSANWYPIALESAATWQPGDPRLDIDGEPRPTAESPDFAGADRLP